MVTELVEIRAGVRPDWANHFSETFRYAAACRRVKYGEGEGVSNRRSDGPTCTSVLKELLTKEGVSTVCMASKPCD